MAGSLAGNSLGSKFIGNIETAYIVVHDTLNTPVQDKIFEVQFNPSQIQIYASCTPTVKSNPAPLENNDNTVQTVVDTPSYPTYEMTVQLLFDDVFPADSFMWEKITSGISTQSIKTIASLATKKVYSVQPQIEALVATLRERKTRTVTFHWADFQFSGQVSQIMAKYTMFSVSGRPVRGVVNMRLRQKTSVHSVRNNWAQDFQKAFGGAPSSSSLVRPGQMTSSLLNFNF